MLAVQFIYKNCINNQKDQRQQNFKGYCILMPIEPELGITAPWKLWCTAVALFTSCIGFAENPFRKYGTRIGTQNVYLNMKTLLTTTFKTQNKYYLLQTQ